MSSQIDYAIQELRQRILSRDILPGERMVELDLSAQLAVSRTPIRIALGELEKEGLLERLPTRGFRVRQFTVDDIADAVDVRGVLEGMAARQAAERGVKPQVLAVLQTCVDEGREILRNAALAGHVIDASAWIHMNARFHQAVVDAAANSTLDSALAHVSKTPMAGAGALSLNGRLPFLEYT
ncbi:MAG: GntR family transcriptional regulator, partial [Haliea sp.]